MYKNKWYLKTSLISICFALWFLLLPLIVGLILLNIQKKYNKKIEQIFLDNEIEDIMNIRKTRDGLEKGINELSAKKENLLKELNIIDQLKELLKEKEKVQNEINELINNKQFLLEEIKITGDVFGK